MSPTRVAKAATAEQLEFRASREICHTVITVIAEHLREDAAVSWQGVVFDGGDLSGAEFSDGTINFDQAEFSDGTINFG
jgi:hypothetical protein